MQGTPVMDTKDRGWPISAPFQIKNNKVYIDARKGLSPYGFFNDAQRKKGVFKQIELLLKHYNLQENDVFMDLKKKEFISAEAYILTLIAGIKLRDPTRAQIQCAWTQLCRFFAKTIVRAIFENDCHGEDTICQELCLCLSTPPAGNGEVENSPITPTQRRPLQGCIRKKPDSTSTLVERLMSGQSLRSTKVEERVKKQSKIFIDLATEVHHGSKVDLVYGIAQSVGRNFKPSESDHSTMDWQGELEKEDVIMLTKLIRNKQGDTLYHEIAAGGSVQVSAATILKLQDQCNSSQVIEELRKVLPLGCLSAKKNVAELKAKYYEEFEAIMQPKRTPTGYHIEPSRLIECLQFLYHWLPKEQWWHLYGDGRKYGKKDTVMMAVTNVNNEQKLNGIKLQSPKEMWPIHVFYQKDSRRNLELNIGDGHGGPGYLNEWIMECQQQGHKVFLGADSKFLDAIADPDLSPLSQDKWNLWMQCSASEKGNVSQSTGMRTDLNLQFDRPHPKSLLPDLTSGHFVLCIDHGFTRVVENLVMKVARTSLDLESRYGKERRNAALAHLVGNINARDVRGGHFELPIDPKGQLGDLSLNKSQAYTILAPPEDFHGKHYKHILDNVLPSCDMQEMLPLKITEALQRTSQKISDIECVKLIWWHFYQMYRILRRDVAKLKTDCAQGSKNVEDYEFGLQEDEIEAYIHHANIFHSLTAFRYGHHELTPYMMKFVDVVPKLLRSLPFKSLMRVATEGGERTHYMHICFYYQHSTRDGGLNKPDTILSLLSWSYRNLRERINDYTEEVKSDFDIYAARHVAAYKIQKWWKTVYSRPIIQVRQSNNTADVRPRQLLPLQKMDFVLVGRMPGATQKKFTERIEQQGGRVISMPKDNLPHDGCYLVCIEDEVKRESSKLNHDLVLAYRRRWKIVKPSFIDWATKEKRVPTFSEHAVDLSPLEALSSGTCGAVQQSVDQLRFSKDISGFAALKRTIREVDDNSPANQPKKKRIYSKKRDVMVSPKKPPNAWHVFLSENMQESVKNNQSSGRNERVAFHKSVQELSSEWRQLSPQVKEGYKEKATELRINRRIVRRRLREEAKENVRAEELREKSYKTILNFRI